MKNKKFYIVQGLGESTGCRLMTKILIKFGCYGRDGHEQDFDEYIKHNDFIGLKYYFIRLQKMNVMPVIRFSYPHGHSIINIFDIYKTIKEAGFNDIYIIYTTRSLPATIISTEINHFPDKEKETHPAFNDEHRFSHNRPKLAHINNFHQLYKIYKEIDRFIINRFTIINLLDLAMNTEIHLKYICKELNLNYDDNLDFSFIIKDVNTKRLNEYKAKYL